MRVRRSERGVHVFEERLNDGLVAFEKHPLTDPLRRDEPRALQGGEVRRHGGLRQAAARVDLARAHAVVERQLLIGEMHARLAQPAENLPADRVGQRFVDRVEIGCHVDGFGWFGNRHAGWRACKCIATGRSIYRNLTICLRHYSEWGDTAMTATRCKCRNVLIAGRAIFRLV
jgi:hypothetical protein